MAEECQIHPLAPAKIYGRSDEEFAAVKPNKTLPRRSNKCLVYVLAGIVLQSALILIFASAVLRVATPKIRLSAVAVKNLRYATSPSPPSLNATVVAEIGVDNNNFGRFKFEDSSIALLYGYVTVGGHGIGGGRARARKVERWNVTLDVRESDLLRENGNFSNDLSLGLVKLRSYARLIGRVRVMKIVNKRESAFMNCSMTLNLTSKAVQDLRCV